MASYQTLQLPKVRKRTMTINGRILGKGSAYKVAIKSLGNKGLKELTPDIIDVAKDDVQSMLRQIAEHDIKEQTLLGNNASVVHVDKHEYKAIKQAEKLVEVTFGTTFQTALLNEVKSELIKQIRMTTTAHSGKLSDPSSWRWIQVRNKRTIATWGLSISPNGLKDVQARDRFFLIPKPSIYYATIVNHSVASNPKHGVKRMRRRMTHKDANGKRHYEKIESFHGEGYLKRTIDRIKRLKATQGVTMAAGFTRTNRLRNEVYNPKGKGEMTGYIVIYVKAHGRYSGARNREI